MKPTSSPRAVLVAVVLVGLAVSLLVPILRGASPFRLGIDLSGGTVATYRPDFSSALEAYRDAPPEELLALAKETLSSRLRQKLSTVPEVLVRGDQRIVVSVPSRGDQHAALDLVGRTYHLAFRLVLDRGTDHAPGEPARFQYRGRPLTLGPPVFSGDMLDARRIRVDSAGAAGDRGLPGAPQVSFRFRPPHDRAFADFTRNHVGRQLAILLDDDVRWLGKIESAITDVGTLSGSATLEEATDVAMLLRSGTLPLALHLESLDQVGPTLGQKLQQLGLQAAGWTLALLLAVVALATWHRRALLIAGVSSLGCLLLLIAGAVHAFGVTLDLAAIAGTILSVGMGIDASIIVFESLDARRRAEVGSSPWQSIRRATSFAGEGRTLLHANATTAVVISLLFATERLSSFAELMFVGIGASVATIFVTRWILLGLADRLDDRAGDPLGRLRRARPRLFRLRRAYFAALIAGLVATAWSLAQSPRGAQLALGPDFRPGVQLVVTSLEKAPLTAALHKLEGHFPELPARIQTLGAPERGRYLVTLGGVLESDARAEELRRLFADESVTVDSLTSIDSKVSSRRLLQSLSVLVLSFLCLALYFVALQGPLDRLLGGDRWRDSLATRWLVFAGILTAVVADVAVILIALAWLHIQVSLPVIAGLLAVIGYSVNDSVVLWSHVRHRRTGPDGALPATEVVTAAVDDVLSRTVLTSVSTLVPAATILAVGLTPLADFAWVILIGTVAGTLSSLFVVGSFAAAALARESSVAARPAAGPAAAAAGGGQYRAL